MKIIKIIFNIFLSIISILLIIVNVYFYYGKFVLKNDVIDFFGYSFLIVVSGSMEPSISINDIIVIKKQNNYLVNDIITYKSNNSLITHRIVNIEGDKIYTKGDSNNTEDEPIKIDVVQGKVVFIGRKIGSIINIILSPMIITIFIMSLILIFIRDNIKERL